MLLEEAKEILVNEGYIIEAKQITEGYIKGKRSNYKAMNLRELLIAYYAHWTGYDSDGMKCGLSSNPTAQKINDLLYEYETPIGEWIQTNIKMKKLFAEELKKMNEIVAAYSEGKKIEFRKRTDSFCKSYVWKELKEPNFNFVENEYRIFTEPSYMKLGRDELEMLRRDYKWLTENHTKVELATAKVQYNIFQISDLIDAMSDMKSFIINQMPLKEAYKEELEAYKAKYGELDTGTDYE